MDLGLAGRVALVTGASRGIGRAIAAQLAEEGAVVYDLDRTPPADPAALHWRDTDVDDSGSVQAAVDAVMAREGRIDVLVNNAGVRRDRIVWRMEDSEWDEVLRTNLTGAFYAIRAVAPVMRQGGWGRIVSISSINGLRGKAGQANYAAAKAGLLGLTKTCARELGGFGITVNAVAPGMIQTEMLGDLSPEVIETARAESVLRRLGTVRDVAAVTAFLCSERAGHLTGTVVQVDGGQRL